jgi:hypothetical protein
MPEEMMVPWTIYERDRAADERLRAQQREALNDVLREIRDDVGDVRPSVAEIKANDKRRIGVLIASLLIPLGTSLIMLFVTLQVTSR